MHPECSGTKAGGFTVWDDEAYPAIKSVLERTLGVPILQEQVTKLAMVAAGFTVGEAVQLRRAMASWKQGGHIEQLRAKLLNGMRDRGYPEAFSDQAVRTNQRFQRLRVPRVAQCLVRIACVAMAGGFLWLPM